MTLPLEGTAKVLQPVRALANYVGAAMRFIHISTLAFSVILPLLGAASVTRALSIKTLALLLAVAVAFHLFAYLFNDLVDIHIDRTQPLRQTDLLVSGAISPKLVLAIALTPIPLSISLTALASGDAGAYAFLALAYSGLALYNLVGKRCAIPILTDLVQGIGWSGLVYYGALIGGHRIGWSTIELAVEVTVFVAFINGVHASLRDVSNDFAHNAKTTPLLFGVRPDMGRTILIPLRFLFYALALQAMFVGILGALLLNVTSGYSILAQLHIAVIITAIIVLSLVVPGYCAQAYRRHPGNPALLRFGGLLHILLSLAALTALYLQELAPLARYTLLFAFFLPAMIACSLSFRAVRPSAAEPLSERTQPLTRSTMRSSGLTLDT